MKNLITQKKVITMNDYKFPEERGNQKAWVAVGIISLVGLIIIVSTMSIAFVAGVVAIFTSGF